MNPIFTKMKKYQKHFQLTIKILLLCVFLNITNPNLSQRIQEIGFQPALVFFLFVWLIGAFAFIAFAFLRHKILRILWMLVWLVVSIFGAIFLSITNKEIGLSDIETLLGLTAFIDNIWAIYYREVVNALIFGLIGIVAINMPPFLWGPTNNSKHISWLRIAGIAAIPLFPIIPIIATLYLRNGEGTGGMPTQFRVPGFLITLAIESAMREPVPIRQSINTKPIHLKKPKHIVIVMDESIRGDLLDINNAGSASTGLLKYSDRIANFGVASSTANCSATSNVSFRYGATRKSYLLDINTHPSIWAYAKSAGYRTYYLDGQRHDGGLQNFMDANERNEIDDFFQLDKEIIPANRDITLARKTQIILSNAKEPVFIFINKMGAHFPYEGKYPVTAGNFQPTLNQSYFGNDPDQPATKSTGNETNNDHLRFKNSYLNAVSWNVAGFFNELLPQIDLSDIILIYTSDHGQDLHENGKKGFNTHCNSGASSPEEGRVPLLILSGDKLFLNPIKIAARNNFNKASQFNVVPSLLLWLGYDLSALQKNITFEADLMHDLRYEDQKFLSTYFVRFGAKPYWNAIK